MSENVIKYWFLLHYPLEPDAVIECPFCRRQEKPEIWEYAATTLARGCSVCRAGQNLAIAKHLWKRAKHENTTK